MGGAQNDSDIFTHKYCMMLFSAVRTTGAWILTGGTHRGVMKHMGQVARDYNLTFCSTEDRIEAIGVAPWGIVHNREILVNPEGCFPAHFSTDQRSHGRLSCLDKNHSHILLVDDGMNGRDGMEIALRSKLEKFISQQPLRHEGLVRTTEGHSDSPSESGLNIPVVCMVLDGGSATLDMIQNAMLNGTPCVILEGSGRLADVIAQVAERPIPQVTLALIRQLMMQFFSPKEFKEFQDLQLIEWTKKIQDILRTPHLLTVFHIDEEGQSDMDVAILRALLKEPSSSDSSCLEPNCALALELGIAWGRLDIAKSEILTKKSYRTLWLTSSGLEYVLISALEQHKPDFVKLLLQKGVSLRESLTEDTLSYLYDHLKPGCLFQRRLDKRMGGRRGWQVLRHVSDEVHHYLGSFTKPIYPLGLARPPSEDDLSRPCSEDDLSNMSELKSLPSTCLEGAGEVSDPGRDLFLWAILQNRKELAEISWEQCSDSMCAALAASKILKKLSLEEVDEGDEADKMQELANYFAKQAIAVLNKCYSNNQKYAQKLLIRISPSWGRTTCLHLALEAHDKSFVAHAAVQGLLTQIWCRELAVDNRQWKIFLCMLFIPLIYTGLLTFRKFKMYISDLWNILDMLSILLFIIGLAFRLTTVLFYTGKVMLCIDFMVFCMRLMAVLTISKTLGPKIIIVKRMGVAKQGILIHNEDRLNWIIRGVVYEPYLIIFGNVPTNNDNVDFDMGKCSVNRTDPVKPKCPILNANSTPAFPECLTIILLCVYLLFTNILLLNLLIAIFNFTFQKVQDDTDTIWNIQYYELIKEYNSRPVLPPPFIIINHLYLFIRWVVLRKSPRNYKQFWIELDQETERELLSWEAFIMENHLASSQRELNQSMERRIQDTSDKVGIMVNLLERGHDRDSLSMAKRLAHLEEQVDILLIKVSLCTKALQEIRDSLKSQGNETQADAPVPSLERNPTDQAESQNEKVKEKTEYHVNARRLQYPGSHVRRFPVPEEMVPWEVEFVEYDPPVYNADEETISAQSEQAGGFKINLNSYRNPEGRTGMQGTGALNHLGPNQVLDPVITCWRDDQTFALEFLAVWDEEERVWTIPGMSRYVDDERNTDTAWVEVTAFNIHLDQRHSLMADIESIIESRQLQWIEVSSRMPVVHGYQSEVLRRVAELHSRLF